MTVLGWIIVIVASLIVGVVAQYAMKTERLPYRWVLTSIATFVGAVACSEWLFAGTTPEYEGIALWPAIIGGLVVGVVVDLLVQYYARHRPGSQGHGAAI